jgi:hypothetical protein
MRHFPETPTILAKSLRVFKLLTNHSGQFLSMIDMHRERKRIEIVAQPNAEESLILRRRQMVHQIEI